MNNTITVKEAAMQAGKEPETIRRGILQGILPGTPIRSEDGSRTSFLIPRRAWDLYMKTGLYPQLLAQCVMQADSIEQGVAYLRAALTD